MSVCVGLCVCMHYAYVCTYITICLPVVEPPVIVDVTLNQDLDISQTATFKCNATGYNISYYWTIGSGSFPSKVTGINSNTLIIPHLTSSDNNLYTCEASNLGGQVNRSKQLAVTGII